MSFGFRSKVKCPSCGTYVGTSGVFNELKPHTYIEDGVRKVCTNIAPPSND